MAQTVDINKVLAAFDAEINFRNKMYSLLEEKLDEITKDDKEIYLSEMAYNQRSTQYLQNFKQYMSVLWQRGELD